MSFVLNNLIRFNKVLNLLNPSVIPVPVTTEVNKVTDATKVTEEKETEKDG